MLITVLGNKYHGKIYSNAGEFCPQNEANYEDGIAYWGLKITDDGKCRILSVVDYW